SNPPPVLSVAPAFGVSAGGVLTFSATASDPEGEVVALTVGSAPDGFTFTASNGVRAVGHARFTPPAGASGAWVLPRVATDALGPRDEVPVLLTVWPTNRPPTISVPPPVEVAEGDVVAIALAAADEDGDPLTVQAEPLPANAVLLQATRTLTFAPDYEQAGEYTLDCRASDGMSTSTSSVLRITVRDTPLMSDPDQLVLTVHPLESPTLLAQARVSGVVNADTNPPPHAGPVSALITGLSPSGARQGEAVAVRLSGKGAAPYATHFAAGESVAEFGEGIVVHSLTVIDATQAEAGIVVAAGAEVGPRAVRVETGAETAWAMPAFQVGAGAATLAGRVVDPDTGQPIAGALVIAEGTLRSATTGADGRFTLTGLPAGPV
ncbi:MAG: carboxypeptidase regulatory-like domain-containing protein, partial [Phycisphaerales bacterium]|nr:carboxypeptidase regulatory-like domain-containing protein [Phycisphaerales bacterium]